MTPSERAAEGLRSLVAEANHFNLSFWKSHRLYRLDEPEVMFMREYFRQNVLAPLLAASSQVILYDFEHLQGEFQHDECAHFDSLIAKKGRSYEIKLSNRDRIIADFPDFWAGIMLDAYDGKWRSRGPVLFLVDDELLDFPRLFACFQQSYVVSNLGGAIGRGWLNRGKKYAACNPGKTAVGLSNGMSLTFFPGCDVNAERVEQAIKYVAPDSRPHGLPAPLPLK